MFRVKAFRNAADAIRGLSDDALRELAASGRLRDLPGVGEKTERAILEALAGERPSYLVRLEKLTPHPDEGPGAAVRALLKGDCHIHSDWSDGGSPIDVMAAAARDLGHQYIALTDHSPRLTIAHGLSAARLREQLKVVAALNETLAPFRILTGIEVDILEDGALDQEPGLLAQLDVVVASVHSKLRMDGDAMTRRMIGALANPHLDILGHCTGRIVVGRGRPESSFDAELVFAAAAKFDKAVEINSRPERLDPPGGCCVSRSRWGARSASTQTRTRRGSSSGCSTAATGRRSATSPPARLSTSWTPTGSSPGPLPTSCSGPPQLRDDLLSFPSAPPTWETVAIGLGSLLPTR